MEILISSSIPPMLSAQFREYKTSSTHNIEGVFIVAPEKISLLNFCSFANLKILGIGQGGV